MKTIGAFVCLFLLIPTGRLSQPRPLPGTEFFCPGNTTVRHALCRILDQASVRFNAGKYGEAADTFRIGHLAAQQQTEPNLEAHFLWGIANCNFVRHRYQEALEEFLAAREAFASLGDRGSLSALNGSLSSLYSQLGEVDAAIDAAKRGLEDVSVPDRNGSRARLFLLLASLRAQQGKMEESRELFGQAILEADRFDDLELRSNAWDRLGSELLLRKQLPQAEEALLEAYRIRKLNRLPSLAGSYRNLGLLRLEQGDARSASALLDTSIAESKSPRARIPGWRFYHSRGRLRLMEGKLREARADFRLALELARNYRLAVPSSDAMRVSLEGLLQEVYDSFIETASRLYLETGAVDLARETFEAVEENRAASLAARLSERKQFRRRLAPAYWDLLAQLQSAETAALIDNGEAPRQAMRRLRGLLLELEAKAGGPGVGPRADLLERTQSSLDSDTVLLTFHLARPASWLWAVSKSGLSLYRLPKQSKVVDRARRFRQAVLTREAASERLGKKLYRNLFGSLEPQYRNKRRWLLSLDGGLFELPFAALVEGGARRAPAYLIERHSLRIVSGATAWSEAARPSPEAPKQSPAAGAFLGVGDAIYNTADTRWRGHNGERTSGWLKSQLGWPWKASAAAASTLGLSRLPGSGPEVDACAREWNSASILLKGRDATKENVRRALEARPSVAHFAAHVLQHPQRSPGAMIALSVSDGGQDQLLGPVEIGGWNVEAGLVVLSGCSSGVAVAHPGAGLMGMTRAWLMAGARAVVATEWSTPDDSGVFFSRFYRHLKRSEARDPAEALRAAQLETLRSAGWRSHPGYWAAYFALGNY